MLEKKEEFNGATKRDRKPGKGLEKGTDLDGEIKEIKLELCKTCKEHKRTVVDNVCYDCNYEKLSINPGKLNNLKLKKPTMDYLELIVQANDRERDLLIERCKDIQYTLKELIECAKLEMSDLRKFRDVHNHNADAMMKRELNHEILNGAGR